MPTKSALIIDRTYNVHVVADIAYRQHSLHLPQQMPRSRVRVHNFLSMGIVCQRLSLLLYNSYRNKNIAQANLPPVQPWRRQCNIVYIYIYSALFIENGSNYTVTAKQTA